MLTCRKDGLAAGKAFAVKVLVKSLSGTRYSNVAAVASRNLDPAPGNNRARSTTRVSVPAGD